jgi:hypothetical protein
MRMFLAAHRRRCAAVLAVVAAAAALFPVVAAAQAEPAAGAASFTTRGILDAVVASSARNTWAVGCSGCYGTKPRTFIARWTGAAWRRVPAPDSARGGSLYDVVAASSHTAWAVGVAGSLVKPTTMILRWNGAVWRRVPSPSPKGGGNLYGVAAVSSRGAWAVGCAGCSEYAVNGKTLIERWNGVAWKRVPSPSAGTGAVLISVAVVSARSAWAVGYVGDKTLILHWNGSAWRRWSSPNLSSPTDDQLYAVAASADRAWAVGCTACFSSKPRALVLRWTGTAWLRVPSPGPPDVLYGVAASSARKAWAVGISGAQTFGHPRTLVLRWNGASWSRVPSPTPAGGGSLYSVAVAARGIAWAVGQTPAFPGPHPKTLVLRWNGAAWS